jgi:hypothetical protein
LTVAEAIDPSRFIGLQNLRRHRLRPGGERYKTLLVEVQPGITYRLAAQFHPDKRNKIVEGEYWDPVIWKETPEPCR